MHLFSSAAYFKVQPEHLKHNITVTDMASSIGQPGVVYFLIPNANSESVAISGHWSISWVRAVFPQIGSFSLTYFRIVLGYSRITCQ